MQGAKMLMDAIDLDGGGHMTLTALALINKGLLLYKPLRNG
jgi:hypothetical protein